MLDLPNQLKIKKFSKNDITKKYIKILNDKKLLKHSDQRHKKHTHKSCLSYLNNFKNNDNLFLKIINKKDLIGTCTVYIDKKNLNANLGFLIVSKNNHNKGYTTLVLKNLIKYLFNKKKLKKVTCGTVDINYPMVKVCKNNGMLLEATLKKQKLIKKKLHNVLIYSIFNNK
tara:strand:- start:187 stop:699 length:513 start_codon:yes stop_codon:yes gene_type:complete